jgi:hypothetical protein
MISSNPSLPSLLSSPICDLFVQMKKDISAVKDNIFFLKAALETSLGELSLVKASPGGVTILGVEDE